MIGVLEARQFESSPSGKLEIPSEYLAGYEYRLVIEFKGGVMRGWCGAWETAGPHVTLKHVLLDTSRKHNGMTLKAIRTYYPWVSTAFAPIMIMPLADDRPEEED